MPNDETPPTHNLSAALDLAKRGWQIGPCDPRPGKWAKAPIGWLVRDGHQSFTDNPGQITAWWTERPDALIGGRVPPHLFVLDVDPRSGATVQRLTDAFGGSLLETPTVRSGRGDGGVHLYYRLTDDRPLHQGNLPAGYDLKTHKGYVILPPSLHPDTGQPYTWARRGKPREVPGSLWESLVARPGGPAQTTRVPGPDGQHRRALARGAGWARTLATKTEGDRQRTLNDAVWSMAKAGAPEEVFDLLYDAALQTGLTDCDVAKTILSTRNKAGAA